MSVRSSTHCCGRSAYLEWSDGLTGAWTDDKKYVITSPNMDFVPKPQVGIVHVRLRVDGRYGTADPVQWPQVYTDKYSYLCAIRRPVLPRDPLFPLWWTPAEDTDFEVLTGSLFTCLGLLRWSCVAPLNDLVEKLLDEAYRYGVESHDHLRWLTMAMRHVRDRLRCFPCRFRDTMIQVREVQHYWLMVRAFLDYPRLLHAQAGPIQPTRKTLMGAFTTDPATVQRLFTAGVPVWFIRSDVSILKDTTIRHVCLPLEPSTINMELPLGVDHILYRGLTGEGHLAATARGGHTYHEIARAPLLAVDEDGRYHSPPSQNSYKASNTPLTTSGSSAGPVRRHVSQKHPGSQPCKWMRQVLACLLIMLRRCWIDSARESRPRQVRGVQTRQYARSFVRVV